MIGLIWNIRGLGQPGKVQCHSDTIAKSNTDFIGFQETKREFIYEGFLKAIDRTSSFIWHFFPSINITGGILVSLQKDIFEVVDFANK